MNPACRLSQKSKEPGLRGAACPGAGVRRQDAQEDPRGGGDHTRKLMGKLCRRASARKGACRPADKEAKFLLLKTFIGKMGEGGCERQNSVSELCFRLVRYSRK